MKQQDSGLLRDLDCVTKSSVSCNGFSGAAVAARSYSERDRAGILGLHYWVSVGDLFLFSVGKAISRLPYWYLVPGTKCFGVCPFSSDCAIAAPHRIQPSRSPLRGRIVETLLHLSGQPGTAITSRCGITKLGNLGIWSISGVTAPMQHRDEMALPSMHQHGCVHSMGFVSSNFHVFRSAL